MESNIRKPLIMCLAALGGSNSNITHFVSVTCYQSDDLINWKFVNDVMTSRTCDGHEFPWWIGRLGVAYVPEAKKYAIFIQYNESVGSYSPATLLPATSAIINKSI